MDGTTLPPPPAPDVRVRRRLGRLPNEPLFVLMAWFFGIAVARHRLGFLTPTTWIFLATAWIPFVVVAFAASRTHGRIRKITTAAVTFASLVTPVAATALVPALGTLETTPIPGGPAFVVSAAPDGRNDRYLIEGGGVRIVRLTMSSDAELSPDLSPDGRRIVYTSDVSGTHDLYVMDLDPQERPLDVERITHDDTWEDEPTWSPDGSRILFTVRTGAGSDLAVADADGEHRRFLTDDHGSINPSWSPDGAWIAFRRPALEPPADDDIWTMRAGGSDARDVITLPGPQWGPSWSPHGDRLAFSGLTDAGADVFVANIDGTGISDLTADSADTDTSFGWSPQGQVLFLSDRSHTGGTFLYFMEPDGSDVHLAVIL